MQRFEPVQRAAEGRFGVHVEPGGPFPDQGGADGVAAGFDEEALGGGHGRGLRGGLVRGLLRKILRATRGISTPCSCEVRLA